MTTTTTSVVETHETRARDWFGWRPSSARRCPLALAGRRCRGRVGEPCLCGRRVLDHRRRWIDRDGVALLTAEPYGADGDELAELVAELAALGLRLDVGARSPYYPGSTVLLTIRRAETTVRPLRGAA